VNGNYTVKSAYMLFMSLQEKFSSSSDTTSRNWNAFWKQQVPPRIRSTLWSMAHSCLTTCSRLLEKGLPINDNCVHYEQLAETHIHTFFVCPKAMKCWKLIELDNTVRNLLCTANDFTSILFDFLNKISAQQHKLASMILLSLWKSRNSRLWEGTYTPSESIVLRAKNSLQEWIHM